MARPEREIGFRDPRIGQPASFSDIEPFLSALETMKPLECQGVSSGGEYEIRTREGVNPTRFPSVRHRPLGEFSDVISF